MKKVGCTFKSLKWLLRCPVNQADREIVKRIIKYRKLDKKNLESCICSLEEFCELKRIILFIVKEGDEEYLKRAYEANDIAFAAQRDGTDIRESIESCLVEKILAYVYQNLTGTFCRSESPDFLIVLSESQSIAPEEPCRDNSKLPTEVRK